MRAPAKQDPAPAKGLDQHDQATHLNGLDGLRALAAVAVAILHICFFTNRPRFPMSLGEALVQSLRLGVPLFFVLSGTLLYLPWARAAATGAAPPRLRSYALRRAARLLPAYYLALIGSALILAPVRPDWIPRGAALLSTLTLTQTWFHSVGVKIDPPAWTLTIEASFYVLLPALGFVAIRWLRTMRAQLLALGLLAAASIAANGLLFSGQKLWHWSVPGTFYSFALGMGVAVLLVRGPQLGAWARRVLIAGGALIVLADGLVHQLLRPRSIEFWQDLPAALGFAAIVFAVARTPESRLLGSRLFEWVGQRSYGLYLWHFPVLRLLSETHTLPHNTGLAIAVVLAISISIAALSWRFLEQPVIERVRRGTRRPAPSSQQRQARAAQPSFARGRA